MREDQLRIGDAERERAATDLGEHYAQGRLSTEEHAERLDRIWAARTRADLGPVFGDLPAGTGRVSPPTPAVRRREAPRRPVLLLAALAVLIALSIATNIPFVLAGAFLALFVVVRRARWSGCAR